MTYFEDRHIQHKAIAYYRHSAEDKQEQSVPIQRQLTQAFAQKHDIEIIHEEYDEGETGLLASRPGFKRLFSNWIYNNRAPHFDYVFIYDVSRWGRFQDLDESASYEFKCKKRGKTVVYVALGFLKKDEPFSYLYVVFERWRAAQFSRDLSNKVFHGCVEVSKRGYSAGGGPCYGMGRQLLDINKQPIRMLKTGEHKQISNERVIFVPLNDQTTNTVRAIFSLFVHQRLTPREIANLLNQRGIPSAHGGVWNRAKIIKILTNQVYAGTRVYNKTWNRLRAGKRLNPRDEWVIVPKAFAAAVDPVIFEEAQRRLRATILAEERQKQRSLRKAKAIFREQLLNFLKSKNFTPDQLSRIMQFFPVVFGASTHLNDSTIQWCFYVPEALRSSPLVIGVSATPDLPGSIDRFFLIPENTLGAAGAVIFTEQDHIYSQYHISTAILEIKIMSILQSIKNRHLILP